MIYFVVGSTGAGKTTYATQLAHEKDAVLFVLDEWMKTLFIPDLESQITFDWAMERIERCENIIWSMVAQLIKQKTCVVLEVSTSTKELRNKQTSKAKHLGSAYEIHFLDVEKETRRKRVEARNQETGSRFSLQVTPEMFDFVESMFEPPTEDPNSTKVIRG